MQKDIIVFDIDGTLSLVGDRKECLQRTPKDWDEFYARCGEDEVNPDIMWLARKLVREECIIIFVTGRREGCRRTTEAWLENAFGFCFQAEALLMRPDGDYRHDTIVKPELVAPFMDRIQMVFEDRDSMVKKWRELGITCLQVADGSF